MERPSSVIHRSLSARVQGRGLKKTEMHRSITDLHNFESWRRSMQQEVANNQTCRNALLFVSAKSTCCVKLDKTAENGGAKPEKCLCELLRCSKHAERDKSTRRFKSRFRLSAAEQAKAHISSLDRVAATWHACANMRSQENQQDASRPVSDELLRSKHDFTSVRPIRWLRPRMTPAMCSSKLWRYVPLPACCL